MGYNLPPVKVRRLWIEQGKVLDHKPLVNQGCDENYQVDYSSFINTSEIELQEDYIYQLNRDKLSALENEIKNGIKSRGILNVDIAISADIFVKAMEINGIFVDLTNAVIEKNEQHIDIKKEVEEVILSKVNIEKEKIEYSG